MASSSGSVSPRKRTCSALFPESPPPPTSLVLEAGNYSSKILSGLDGLRETGDLCDYTLLAEGKTLRVRGSIHVQVRTVGWAAKFTNWGM